jgi:phage terminase small subunit
MLNPPKAPRHLKRAGAKLWADLVEQYAISDAAGLALLQVAAECVDRQTAARAAILKHGEVVTDRYGAPKLNPALALEKDARNGLLAALKSLNLDVEPIRDGPGRPPNQRGK